MTETEKLKISFDFDNTLALEHVQEFFSFLQKRSCLDLWIVTTRYNKEYRDFSPYSQKPYGMIIEHNNEDLFNVANKLNIDNEKIIFTNGEWKYKTLKEGNFAIHIDDFDKELELIKGGTKTFGINVQKKNWKQQVVNLINLFCEKQGKQI